MLLICWPFLAHGTPKIRAESFCLLFYSLATTRAAACGLHQNSLQLLNLQTLVFYLSVEPKVDYLFLPNKTRFLPFYRLAQEKLQIRNAPILMYNGVDYCLGLSARELAASRVRVPFCYRYLKQIKIYNPGKFEQ